LATLKRPGVFVDEVLNRINTDSGDSANSAAALIGAGNRGPTTPTLLSTWADFVSNFGGFGYHPYLANAVFSCFSNGGGPIYATRVAPTDALPSTITLNDNSGSGGIATLSVTAANPGAWGNQIYLDVTYHNTSGLFDLIVKYGGTGNTAIAERYMQLSLTPTDARYAPNVINHVSLYITVADQHSATVAPANQPLTGTSIQLASGRDGTVTVGVTDYSAALAATLGATTQPLVINLAGVTDTATLNAAVSVVSTAGNAFLVCDLPIGVTAQDDINASGSITPSNFAATYASWLVVNDPSQPTPGITKKIPPGGAVVGQFINTDETFGPWKSPAGTIARIVDAVDTVKHYSDNDLDALYSAQAPTNPIHRLPNFGICIDGGRTLALGTPAQFISVRRSLIYLEKYLRNLSVQYVHYPNDQTLWTQIDDSFNNFLTSYWRQGGLAGSTAQQAFYVLCDSSINTVSSIQAGVVNVQVGVALEFPAEYIVITLGEFQGNSLS
jgi:phage tail sheath protein FI